MLVLKTKKLKQLTNEATLMPRQTQQIGGGLSTNTNTVTGAATSTATTTSKCTTTSRISVR
ncbi:hypothetical protein JF50_20055 [Pseudoalteromonas luteoviolacea]|uniref:Uncharacterized protein n=1 Tax=Pseudoalteromonas luteoviolacea TaxID=43657 RepID=A0A0C1Q4M8_9GAMM|nr:hypothetical protein [Pseudoalteromonas luteoviolacea]KID55506.1 hypothetical protein JF50_20055 [Pseudoalteromonas luteoviolacea]